MNEPLTPNKQPIDDQVVLDARTNRDALGVLYDATYPLVCGYCLRRVGQRSIAEDIVSNVFLNVANNMREFPGKTFVDFRRWVFTITTNEMNASFRKSSRRHEILLRAASEGFFSEQADQTDDEESSVSSLQSAIERLPQRDQTMVSMRYFAGLPCDDIADVLDMTPGSVRTALSRCLQKLRHQIESES